MAAIRKYAVQSAKIKDIWGIKIFSKGKYSGIAEARK